jgi:hypothetical protein
MSSPGRPPQPPEPPHVGGRRSAARATRSPRPVDAVREQARVLLDQARAGLEKRLQEIDPELLADITIGLRRPADAAKDAWEDIFHDSFHDGDHFDDVFIDLISDIEEGDRGVLRGRPADSPG